MSSFNPLNLLASPITGAFQYAGAKKEADAQKQAAQLQAQAAQNALDFTKQKQAEQQAAFMPYQNLGGQAVANLPGVVRPMPTQGPPAPYTTQPGATMPAPQPTTLSGMGQPLLRANSATVGTQPVGQPQMAPQGTGGAGNGQMVTLQAPDGTQKQVPAAQAAFYISRGARQVS